MEKLLAYLRGTREEIRKVSWPSRKETTRYSALVVGASLVVAVFFATLDFGFTKLVDVAITQRSAALVAPPAPPATSTPVETSPAAKTPTLDLKDIQTTPGSGSVKVTPIDTTPIQLKNN